MGGIFLWERREKREERREKREERRESGPAAKNSR